MQTNIPKTVSPSVQITCKFPKVKFLPDDICHSHRDEVSVQIPHNYVNSRKTINGKQPVLKEIQQFKIMYPTSYPQCVFTVIVL